MNIIEMARDSGLVLTCDMQDAYIRDGRYGKQLERFAALVRNATLEEAAGVCESKITGGDYHHLAQHGHWDHMAQSTTNCAAAIRALKEKT